MAEGVEVHGAAAPREVRPAPVEPGETHLRTHARALLETALSAVDPAALVKAALEKRAPEPPEGGRLVVLAVGKAALAMATGAHRALGGRIDEGIVLVPSGWGGEVPPGFAIHRGSHPLPDADGLHGARAMLETARRARASDRLLLLLSGGGSALLTLPAEDISLDDVRRVTRMLLEAGAPIQDLNAVRKHLEVLKGGGLARVAMPAPVRALVLSDVVGDPLDVIASGPVSADRSTFSDAIAALERHGVWRSAPEAVRRRLLLGREGEVPETPREGNAVFSGVAVEVIGSVADAVEAAAARGRQLGYDVHVGDLDLTGEARHVGRDLVRGARGIRQRCPPPIAMIAAGETTVTVRGEGRGGRSQEVALGAALELDGDEPMLILAAGTDGVDGPTAAAGAIASGSTLRRALVKGLDPMDSLERNDAYPFFDELGDLVRTGPTGTNVMDLMLVLVGG